MRNFKILMFLFVAVLISALFTQCNSTSKENKISELAEKQKVLTVSEHVLQQEMKHNSDVFTYSECVTAKDSAVKEAEYLVPFFNYLGNSDIIYEESKYSILYDNVRDSDIKKSKEPFILVIVLLMFLSSLLYILNNKDRILKSVLLGSILSIGILFTILTMKNSMLPDSEIIKKEVNYQYFVNNTS